MKTGRKTAKFATTLTGFIDVYFASYLPVICQLFASYPNPILGHFSATVAVGFDPFADVSKEASRGFSEGCPCIQLRRYDAYTGRRPSLQIKSRMPMV